MKYDNKELAKMARAAVQALGPKLTGWAIEPRTHAAILVVGYVFNGKQDTLRIGLESGSEATGEGVSDE